MKSLLYLERPQRAWRKPLLAGVLLLQFVFVLTYFSPLFARKGRQEVNITVQSTISPSIDPPEVVKSVASTKEDGVVSSLLAQGAEEAPMPERIPGESVNGKVSVLPWSRELGPLSTDAILRLNQMRRASKMDDGRVNLFDPNVPGQIEGSMVHCMEKDFDLENKILVVTTIDSTAMHRMPAYLSMISDRAQGDAEVLLLAADVEFGQIEILCDFVKQQKLSTHIHVLMLSSSTMDGFFKYEKQKHGILPHVPVATMARLLLPSLIGDIVETIIYFDIDIILRESLRLNKSVIHNMCPGYDRSVHDLCARESLRANMHSWCDSNTIRILGLGLIERGFNAGVLVLNLASMRSYGFSRFAAVVSRSLGVNDQVILVAYTKDSFNRMDRRFNVFDGQDRENDGEIVHFAGQNNKPWNHWSWGFKTWRAYEYARYLLVWSSFELIPQTIIDSIIRHSHGRTVSIYCASVSCREQVSGIGYPLFPEDIQSLRWHMRSDTPLKGFFSKMQMYKILMEGSFPAIWSMALRLTVLYNRGGMVLPSGARLIQDIPEDLFYGGNDTWFGESHDPQHFFAYAKPKDGKVLKLVQNFMTTIEKSCLSLAHDTGDTTCSNLISKAILSSDSSIKTISYYDYFEGAVYCYYLGRKHCLELTNFHVMCVDCPEKAESAMEKHYSVLWYDTRVRSNQPGGSHYVANVGDEMQSLASVSWLPFVDVRVERDNLTAPLLGQFPEKSIKTFMNGWYGSSKMPWPPHQSIDPIFLAVHIEQSVYDVFSSSSSTKYLGSGMSVVGARDVSTETFLADKGVSTFFSGCMTLTTYPIGERTAGTSACDYIVVDISERAYQMLPDEIKSNKTCRISHRLEGDKSTVFNGKNRFIEAFKMLERYSSAKVVITSRLHSALPASSIGATVIMIESENLPGGGKGKNNSRFSGLDSIFFMVEESSMQHQLRNFTWDKPPGNPGAHLIQKFRCNILRFLRQYHNELNDVIRMFDLHGVFDPCEL